MLTSGSPIPRPDAAPSLEDQLKEALASGKLQAPSFPSVALEVNRILRNPRSSAADLAKAVASDETLAVKVLRRANGPGMAAGQGLTSLPLAVARLGRREIAEIVYAASLGATAEQPGPLLSLRRYVWLEAVLNAVLCKRMAGARAVNPDEAFLAGLVHDFGRVLTIGALEDLIGQGVEVQPQTMSAWLELIDRHHLAVGARAVEQWRLPEALSDAIRHHHQPRRSSMQNRALVMLVAIADQVLSCCHLAPHVTRDQLAKVVKIPLRGAEATIANAIPGTGEEAVALVAATTNSSKTPKTPLVLDETLLASDHYALQGEVSIDDGPPLKVTAATRDGLLIDHVGGGGLRLATVCLTIDGNVVLRATAMVQGFEDNTECRWFALPPHDKREWDRNFRAARSN